MGDLDTPGTERPGIGRRTLIKRAAATGAVAWTAPMILDSLASPAAALSCASCFRVTFPADDNGVCDAPSVAVAGVCAPTTTGPGCTTPTDLAPGTTEVALCMSNDGFCGTQSNIFTFGVNATATNCFAACSPNRRFLAARAELKNTTTNAVRCVDAALDVSPGPFDPPPPNARFTGRQDGEIWVNFTFVIGCGCS